MEPMDSLKALKTNKPDEYAQLIERARKRENPSYDEQLLACADALAHEGVPWYWTPPVGTLVKLRTMMEYVEIGLPAWSWMKVLEVNGEKCKVQHHNGGKIEGEPFELSTPHIDPPLGWEPIYTVAQYEDIELEKVRLWLRTGRGVAVWVSHDLSTAGRAMYTPGDSAMSKPHWSMVLVDIIADSKRLKFVKIEKHSIPTNEQDRKARKRMLAQLRAKFVEVHNIYDGNFVVESWYETEKEVEGQ